MCKNCIHKEVCHFKKGIDTEFYAYHGASYNTINCGHFKPERKTEEKFEVIEKFRDALMGKFIELCDNNDYNKINLLLIGNVIEEMYELCCQDIRIGEGNV